MTQTVLTNSGIKRCTKIEKLELLRKNYHTQLIRELETLKIRKKQLIMSYRMTVKDIDEEIQKEYRRQK